MNNCEKTEEEIESEPQQNSKYLIDLVEVVSQPPKDTPLLHW